MMRNFTLGLLLFLCSSLLYGQVDYLSFAEEKLEERGEFYFTFPVASNSVMYNLSRELSIDGFEDGLVYAYANTADFENFLTYGIEFTPVFDYYNSSKALTMATTVADMANWDRYPTHAVYLQMMQDFATNYPDLCEYEVYGYAENGTPIVGVVISDNVGTDEDEPEFWWSSTMHGDELVCYVLTLRMIDYLLSNYGTDPQVTNLVDNIEIYINPLANPEGTFRNSATMTSVSDATRYNANGIDLNRNFPTLNGDSYTLQEESQTMIDYSATRDFVMSVNTHSGTELLNYPWDTWQSWENLNADDDWWQYVGFVYADQVEIDAPATYFEGPGTMDYGSYNSTGVTHGADWYYAIGSRQDYMNYHRYIQEVTLEWSDDKDLDVNLLPDYWGYNKDAMLLYTEQVLYGLRGIVTDSCTGLALSDVKVEIIGHDEDNSEVYSSAPVGNYHRPIYEGTYDFTYSLTGYQSQTHTVTITNDVSTRLDIVLVPADPIASFTSEEITTCNGVIQFINNSENAFTYLWDFGDGSTSTEENPQHFYSESGVYTVSLTAQNSCYSDTYSVSDMITVDMPDAPTITGDESCGPALLTLTASGSGTLVWYDAETGGTEVTTGTSYTNTFTNTTTLYVQSEIDNTTTYNVGPTDNSIGGGGYFGNSSYVHGLIFDAYTDFTLVSVWVDSESEKDRVINLKDASDNIIETRTVNIPAGESRVTLNIDVPTGTNYTLECDGDADLYRNNSGASYPYTEVGVLSIHYNTADDDAYYYFFYDWEITTGDYCISPRTPVTATINDIPDVDDPTDVTACDFYSLPSLTNGEYFTSPNGVDPIAVGTEITSTQTIYVYTDNGDCTAENSFTVTINETPLVDDLNDVEVCESYTLPVLTNGAYYENANGVNAIAEGTEITSTQTIYVYAEIGTTPNCFAETSFVVTINNAAQVDIGDNIIGDCGENVILDAGAGYSSYEWEGSIGTQTYEVTLSDTYTVVVEDANGCTSTDDVDVEIRENPTAEVTTTDGTATVNVTSGVAPFNYMWFDYSQGVSVSGLVGGTYCVTVTDNNNCSVEACGTVNVEGVAPVANFSADETYGCDNLTVQFTDESANFPTTWEWDFGDGSATSSEADPEHTYSAPGIYSVSLTVTNDYGTNSITETDYITFGETPVLTMSMTHETALGNDGTATVEITGGDLPYSLIWSNLDIGETISGLTAGDYCVTVTELHGCSATECVTVTGVVLNPPVADFTADETEACGSLTVNFTDLSTNNPTSWEWNFGDSSTSTEQNPTHEYTSPGAYTVLLTAENADGSDFVEIESFINVFENSELTFNVTNESGIGMSDGEIEMIITGGLAPYQITWSNSMTSSLIDGLSAGMYSVVVIDANSCMTSEIIEVTVSTGVVNAEDLLIEIYPNPTSGEFIIKTGFVADEVSVLDALGRVILSKNVNSEQINIDLDIEPGIYFVKILKDEKQILNKLIVE